MQHANYPPKRLRFGVFEADPRIGELTKHGKRLPLQEQPFQLLAMLLERPGELVSREELRARIWPETIVDFDQGLNKAISKIREALGDSAENPRFIETVARRGYRFLAHVAVVQDGPLEAAAGDLTVQAVGGRLSGPEAGISARPPPRALARRVFGFGFARYLAPPWYGISTRPEPPQPRFASLPCLRRENPSATIPQAYSPDAL